MRTGVQPGCWKSAPLTAGFRAYLWLAVVMAVVLPVRSLAHGGGMQQLANAPAGPYQVFVWTNPDPWRVGATHTTVALTQPLGDGKDATVSGAKIVISMAPKANPAATQRVEAVEGSGAQAGFYEADGTASEVGLWQVMIEITGPQGPGTTSFELMVEPADNVNPLWWGIGAGVVVIFAAGGWWLLRNSQHRPARRTK